MNFDNKYVLRGIALIILGILLVFWNFGFLSLFTIINASFIVVCFYLGFKYLKYRETKMLGQMLLLIGGILVFFQVVSSSRFIGIPTRLIVAIVVILFGLYFLIFKSNIFIIKTGVFRDSREHIIVNEILSEITINSSSLNVSSGNIKSYGSKILLDFSGADLNKTFPVNLNILSVLGKVIVNTNSYWNIMVNGKVIRKVEGTHQTLNIKYTNILSEIEIQ